MAEAKVLITTSGIGSRLGELTNFTNKCLVRVGDKPSISHIIEHYPKGTHFVVTLGHFGSYVRQFLELAYSDRKITFVNVDNFKGEGSSLGHSMLQAKQQLQCPFIFHAADTILTKQDSLPSLSENWCAGSFKKEASQYRTLRISDKKIIVINEKGEINFDYPYIGVCGIKDYKLFWSELENIPNTQNLSDVHVINKMLKQVDFKFHKINKWIDIGNVSELEKARSFFDTETKVLDKNDESIYFIDDFVFKFFANSEVNESRVRRAEDLKNLTPKIIASSENFFKYKKVQGKLFAQSANEKSFTVFLDWLKTNLWTPIPTENFKSKCKQFYLDKTKDRVLKYLGNKTDQQKQINGEQVPPIQDLLNNIDEDWISDGVPVRFHGDLILDNVIQTSDNFSLIDWRQNFAGDLRIGDIYYDLAKLNHNLTVNHSIVDNKLFSSSKDNCYILCKSSLMECKNILKKFVKDNGYDYNKVEVLTSIIWINMSPLHEYPFNTFLFNFGKYNLYKNLKSLKFND